MSSRRSASVVIGLAVASLAVTSMGAMVASSELLVEAVDRPARRRLDPLVLDLGSVGTIQAELPRDARTGRPPARRRPAAAAPAGAAARPTGHRPGGRRRRAGRRRAPPGGKKVVVLKPVFRPPPRPLPPPLPPHPQPRPQWPRRRWVAPPRHHRHRPPCGDRPWRWKDDDDRRRWKDDDDRRRWTWERAARPGRRERPR